MHSTQNPQQVDPHADPHDDVLVARIDEELSKLAHVAMRDPLDPQTHMGSDFSAGAAVPPVDTTFRPAAVNHVQAPRLRPSFGVRAMRGFVGFLLAVCIGVAGVVWQAYGDAAKQMIANRRLRLRLPRKASHRPPPHPNRRCCSSRWPANSQAQGKRSTSSRRAKNKCPARWPSLPRPRPRLTRPRLRWPRLPRSRLPRPRLPSKTCGPGYQRFHRGRSPRRCAGRCRRHIRPRKPPQLPCCHRAPHLTCRGNLNHHRKPRPSRRPSQSFHRCRGRRCPCCASSGSFTLSLGIENRRAKP